MKYTYGLKPRVKRNYVPWNRHWVMVRHHLPIILKPAIIGVILVLIWRFVIYPHGVHFSSHSDNPVLHLVLPLIGFMYVIFASVAIASVFDQYKIISKCVVKKDVDTFLLYRDEQLPIIMHILISAPSLIIILFVIFYDYQKDTLMGMSAVFAVVFMLVLIWVIAAELDDFSKSIWFREKIPPSWYEIDVEKHFELKRKENRL